MTNELMDDVTDPRTPLRKAARVTLFVALAAVALPVLLVAGLVVVYAVERGTDEGYPEVAPDVMTQRAAARSQELYDVAGIGGELPPGTSGGDLHASANTVSADVCYPDGLESVADQPEEGSYRLGHKWRIAGVSEREGVPALRRLRAHVEKTGWHVAEFGASGEGWVLRARRDEDDLGSERIVVTWWSHWRTLDGFTGMSCAYAPSGAGGDEAVKGLEPPTLK